MQIKFLIIGKTDQKELQTLIQMYEKRLSAYISFKQEVIADLKNTKNLSFNEQKEREGELFLKNIQKTDFVVLLDERGKQFSSEEFADFLQKRLNASTKQLVFIVGGAYGFSQAMYARADAQISLSKMTFSHQMIRLFFTEQLYRAFTILRNEPYHHS